MQEVISLSGLVATFLCPGCNGYHSVRVNTSSTPNWAWNGDHVKPTFSPSILVTSGHYCTYHKAGDPCWCTSNDPDFECVRCHSFVTDGIIKFLPDCSHSLAGKEVPLLPWSKP